MPQPHRRRTAKFSVESLEARLNLSGLAALAPAVPNLIAPYNPAILSPTIAGPLAFPAADTSTRAAAAAPVSLLSFGATTTVSGAAAIPIDAYSAISNSRLEWQTGQSSPNIGYISTNGAYVEYAINAATAGTYRIDLGLASLAGADVKIEVNSVFNGEIRAAATGQWATYTYASATVQLAAGPQTLRFTAMNWSQYNLATIALTPTTPATISTVGDNTALDVTTYSAISNAQPEYHGATPDIGYDSLDGAYVDYTINVANAGNYTLTAAAGSWNAAGFSVYANAAKLATFNTPASASWQTSTTSSQTIALNAGVQTLRLITTPGTQYNLFALNLQRQASEFPATTVSIAAPLPVQSTQPQVAVSQRWMTSFTELDIVGTSQNDAILVTQSGATLTITADGSSQQVYAGAGAIGEIVIWGGGGNNTLTVDPSVTLDTRIYGGNATDTILDATRGKATIVTIGGGKDTVTGNGINTSFWVDKQDAVNASAAEIAAGRLHVVNNFYQPYASSTVSNQLDGSNLADPASDGSGWTRLTSSSLFGTGPLQDDINQGAVGDCYFLTALQSLARLNPDKLRELAVDLGDGTYAVQFTRNGVTDFVRVDADLPTSQWGGLNYNRPGASGNQWASIMEKAYAFYRYGPNTTGGNSYASLNLGWMVPVYSDLGINAYTYGLTDQNSFYTVAAAALAANKPVDIGTLTIITAGAPLVPAHTYSLTAITKDAAGNVFVTLRNPWGVDGFSVDSNPWDGFLTLSYATLKANVSSGSIVL